MKTKLIQDLQKGDYLIMQGMVLYEVDWVTESELGPMFCRVRVVDPHGKGFILDLPRVMEVVVRQSKKDRKAAICEEIWKELKVIAEKEPVDKYNQVLVKGARIISVSTAEKDSVHEGIMEGWQNLHGRFYPLVKLEDGNIYLCFSIIFPYSEELFKLFKSIIHPWNFARDISWAVQERARMALEEIR